MSHIVAMKIVVERYQWKNGELFAAAMDLEKAYDMTDGNVYGVGGCLL